MKRKGSFSKRKCLTFLIWGANFNNKGAQAMLFTAVSELRTRFPGSRILFNSGETIPDGYQFEVVEYNGYSWELLKKNPVYWYMRRLAAQLLHRRKGAVADYYHLRKHFKEIDAVVDVSGFAISSQWGYWATKNCLEPIEIAKNYHIPVFLMPQSFGPFDYGENQAEMDLRLASVLAYPAVIFAREKSGFRILTEKYQLRNVRKSADLVLQSGSIHEELIYSGTFNTHLTKTDTGKNVAIIPNMRIIDRGGADSKRLIALYVRIIQELRLKGFHVYLVRHSGEDLAVCEEIYSAIKDPSGVFLRTDDYNCIEFNQLICNFDFIIGSRYHSIVHAYKNSVPAIVLGWAEKYGELLEMFDQGKYMFDVRCFDDQTEGRILSAVRDMELNYESESRLIRNTLPKYQEENCFDAITEYFNQE